MVFTRRYLDVEGRVEPRPPIGPPSTPPSDCPFCQLMIGEVAHAKVLETEHWYAVLDIHPLSDKHTLLFPKIHQETLQSMGDDVLMELGVVLRLLGGALGSEFNILWNQGRMAHQFVDHVHVHVVPKPSSKEGIQLLWLAEPRTKEELALACARLQTRL